MTARGILRGAALAGLIGVNITLAAETWAQEDPPPPVKQCRLRPSLTPPYTCGEYCDGPTGGCGAEDCIDACGEP